MHPLLSLPLVSATFSPHPNHCCREGVDLGNLGNRCHNLMTYVTWAMCFCGSGFPTPVILPLPPLPPPVLPTPLSRWLDRKQSCLCALGPGIAGAAVLVLTNRGDVAGKGNPSSLLGQIGAGGALRSDFIFGDAEAKRGGGALGGLPIACLD